MKGTKDTLSHQDPQSREREYLVHESSLLQFPTVNMPSNPMLFPVGYQMGTRSSLNSRIFSAKSPIRTGNTSSHSGNSLVRQKRSQKAPNFSLSPSSKMHEVSGALSYESSKQFDNVLALSGVDLMKEQSLFSEPKKDTHNSEGSGRFVKEVEDRMFLEKIPLRLKLEQILKRHGLKSMSSDVEQWLSEATEQRMRGLIANMIKLKNLRIRREEPRHKMTVTSDVRQQLMLINQNHSEDCKKKQAETETYQNVDEANKGGKKVQTIDKMGMKAANLAIRAALGDVDMLCRWQLKASHSRKDKGEKESSSSGSRDNQGGERKGNSAASTAPESIKDRPISVKDVIAALERDSLLSKSTLLHRLFEKTCLRR